MQTFFTPQPMAFKVAATTETLISDVDLLFLIDGLTLREVPGPWVFKLFLYNPLS